MKYLLKAIVLLFILASCQKENTNKNISIIEGIANSNFIEKELFLQYIYKDSLYTKPLKIDSNGNFSIELDSINIPTEAILISDTTNYTPKVNINSQFFNKFLFQFGSSSVPVQFGKKIDFKMFIIEKGQIQFNISDSIFNSDVDNSALNNELQKLEKSLNPIMQKYNEHKNNGIDITKLEDFTIMDSLSNAYSKIWQARQKTYRNYILENPNSEISLFALKYKDGGINTDILRLYETLSDSVKTSNFGKNIKNEILNYSKRMNKRLSQKDIVPNFNLKDLKKEEIALYDVKSKYIFLDFWASWCGPCRKENKLIREFYQDFNKSDFEIVSVSVDDSEEKWKKAMIDDNINWISLWDENKKINDQFGIISYPTNFLLNNKYEVIATNLNAKKLKEKLNELIK